MTKKTDTKEILDILLDFRGFKIKQYCLKKLDECVDPYDIFNDLSLGLDEIGRGFESKEFQRYFTSDLIVSGRNMKKAVEMLRSYFKKKLETKGTVIVGTVKGDVHDIGKMIFAITLESNGFRVIDLGVDVSKESFIKKIEEISPDILGMSALLTSTISYMGEVIEGLKKENLRNKVKIIIGGKAVTKNFARKIGADAYGENCMDGLKKCLQFIEAQR